MLTQKQITGALQTSIDQAGTLLDPIAKKISGKYTNNELLIASAYIQLSHAALEVALEQTAISISQRCGKAYLKQKHVRPEIIALVAFYLNRRKFPKDGAIHEPIVKAAVDAHIAAIGQSHGIRNRNVAAMFNPLGMRPVDTHNPLVNSLNSFGIFRGGIAHNGTLGFNQDPIDKRVEVETLIVPQTKAFIDGLKF